MSCESMMNRSSKTLKKNNKFSNFRIKMKKTDACFIYVVYDWHHAGRTEERKGPDPASGPYSLRSVLVLNVH